MRPDNKNCESCGKLFARSQKCGPRRWQQTRFCSTACAGAGKATHGHTRGRRSPEFVAWVGIVGRCTNPKNKDFHKYGGRGICICKNWLESFSAFLQDMGPRPSPDHSVDRVDNNGDYAGTMGEQTKEAIYQLAGDFEQHGRLAAQQVVNYANDIYEKATQAAELRKFIGDCGMAINFTARQAEAIGKALDILQDIEERAQQECDVAKRAGEKQGNYLEIARQARRAYRALSRI